MKTLHFALLGLTFASSYCGAAPAAIEPPMATIPSGEYMMGGGRPYMGSEAVAVNAQPIHKVKIATFRLGKYEVTVKEFRRFVEATGYPTPQQCIHEPSEGWFTAGPTPGSWDRNKLTESELQPVVCVGWEAASAYAKWLSSQTGKQYRLPSEAEWEYVARAGRDGSFYFGEDPAQQLVCEHGNVADRSGEHVSMALFGATYKSFMGGIAACDDGAGFASIVGMYKPGPWGVHDLVGNAAEYVQDCWSENYGGAPTDGRPWEQGACKEHVVRGGAWHWRAFPANLRSSVPNDHVGVLEGFRLAQTIERSQHEEVPASARTFEHELRLAQEVERARRAAILPFPPPPTGLRIDKTAAQGNIVLRWNLSADPLVTGYHVYRAETQGGVYRRLAADVQNAEYVDTTPPQRKHPYVVVAVNRDRFSEFSAAVTSADQVHTLPGRIQAEDFNGYEGASVGRVARQEDTELSADGFALTGPTGVRQGSWTEYAIDVPRAGKYAITSRVASGKGSAGFELQVDGTPRKRQAVPATGGSKKWQAIAGSTLDLPAGRHVLRVVSIADGWKLDWLELAPAP